MAEGDTRSQHPIACSRMPQKRHQDEYMAVAEYRWIQNYLRGGGHAEFARSRDWPDVLDELRRLYRSSNPAATSTPSMQAKYKEAAAARASLVDQWRKTCKSRGAGGPAPMPHVSCASRCTCWHLQKSNEVDSVNRKNTLISNAL